MRSTLSTEELSAYVRSQIDAFYPDKKTPADMRIHVETAMGRLERCFSRIRIKYFFDGEHACFDHAHTDQYAMFLYLLSNAIHRASGDPRLAGKVYALNKALHAIDVYYEVALPEVFYFQHPVGTVIGRGTFENYLCVYQRCSVGANLEGKYPRFGEGVVMFGGASVIGACAIGNNAWLSVNATVMDDDIPDDTVVFGRSPHLMKKRTPRDVVREMFLRS